MCISSPNLAYTHVFEGQAHHLLKRHPHPHSSIFSNKNKTFRDYMSDIVAVATSNKGVFVVFCERELIAYKPLLNGWKKSYNKNCTNPIKDAFFSHDDQYIIGCSQNKLHIWKVEYSKYAMIEQLDQYEIVELNEIFTVEMAVAITNVKFSPDVRFFSTLYKTNIIVWDFDAINHFQQDGDLSQIPKVTLAHHDVIVSYKFRETLRVAPSPYPTPNTIVTLANSNVLTVWQEMIQNKNFCKLHTMHLENVASFCFIFLGIQKQYPWNAINLEPDSSGIQDTEQPSVDYIVIHEEKEIKIVKLNYLRNYSLEESVQVIHKTSGELLKQLKKIIFADPSKGEKEKLEIIGFDRLWNITKIVIDLKERTKQSFQCEKFGFQEIVNFSIYQDQICIINNWNQLCLYPLMEQNIISQEFAIMEAVKKCWNLQNYKQNKYMFLFKDKLKEVDIILMINQEFDNLQFYYIKNNSELQLKEQSYKQIEQIDNIIRIKRNHDNLHLMIIKKCTISQVEITVSFLDQLNIDIKKVRNWEINFNYKQLTILKPDIQFVSLELKSATIYNDNLEQIVTIYKNQIIKEVGKLRGFPIIYYVISSQNEIDFHASTGEFLTRFNLQAFLVRVDKALYDVAKVTLQVIPLNHYAFLLQTDNYISAFMISFDKNDQSYKLNSLLSKNKLYCKRLSKNSDPKCYQVYYTDNHNIVLRTKNKFKLFNNSLIKCLADTHWMPATINYKLMAQLHNVQIYDGDFLQELIALGKLQLVQHIIKLMVQKLKIHGSLGNQFIVPYKNLLELYHQVIQQEPDWLLQIKTYDAPKLDEKTQESIDLQLNTHSTLKSLFQTGQLGNVDSKLMIILDYIQYHEDNRMSLDFYASMFMFYVQLFRNQPNLNKKIRVLSSKEVVWAMHSLQKETLWQECVLSSQELSWNVIRRYAAVIWMDISFIKARMEEIAMEIYKENRNPFHAMLYFLILGKKSVITTLFKREQNQGKEFKNTYEFLERDFTLDRWKSAASKNAYALVSKKRYQDAAAFFLIGGHIKDAVHVIAYYMEDIQLALLTCRLYEPQGGDVTEQLIQDYFIKSGEEMNDIWLLHIGYHLLGRYVDSVNILMREPEHHILEYDAQGKSVCMTWPNAYTPQLSYYHPSAILLVEKLRDAIHVKREIQNAIDKASNKKQVNENDIFSQFYEESEEEEEVVETVVEVKKVNENIEQLKMQAVEYYYNIQIPQLGLIFSIDLEEESKYSQLIMNQQIEMYVYQAVKDQEHFTNYVGLMQKLDDLALFTNNRKDKLYDIAYNQLKSLKSPARLLTYAIMYDQSGLNEFMQFCQETQCLLYRICLNYPLIENQEFYLTLIQCLYEIDVGLKQFQQSQYYQKKFEHKHKLNLIKMFALFLTLIIALELKLWENAFESLRKLETFCNVVYKQQIQDCGYENLRNDFCELVKQTISELTFYANKSQKAHRSLDILSEAFPPDPYQEYKEQNKHPVQYLMLNYALQSQIVKYFLHISETNFKVEQLSLNAMTYSNLFKMAESYVQTRDNMVQSILSNISDFSFEQTIIEDLRMILKEQSLTKSQYFKQLESQFQLQHLFQITNKIQLDSYIEQLNINRTKQAFKYPNSSYEEISINYHKVKLFKQGVEVYRLKTDNIRGLCINNANPNEGYVLYNKFLKYMNVNKTLLYKNRSADGYNLIDEESSVEEPISSIKIPNKPYVVNLCATALGSQQQQQWFKERIPKEPILKSTTSLYDEYKDYTENDYLEKFQTCSTKPIQEEDYQCLKAHPYLPIFLVGGRGNVNVLTFKSPPMLVSEFTTNQREYLDMLKFNNTGELFLGHDLANNAYIWKMNRTNKINTPLITLTAKQRPTTDLTFINEGSIFASIYNSSSKPHYGLYDLLMPSNKNLIQQENFSGTDILYSTPLNSILIANSKKGTVNFLDIRKNQIYKTLEIPFCEIKSIALNQYQTSLICACNDSSIKIISCESLQTICDYKPFRFDRKPPQIVQICQTENATFAASSEGVVSLVYLNA